MSELNPASHVARWRAFVAPTIILMIFVLAAVAIHHAVAEFNYHQLRQALRALTHTQLAFALLATVASYVTLTGYDWSALTYLGKRIPYAQVALTAMCGYAISNTAGLSLLSGGSVRYRLYANHGLDGAEIAQITAFSALAFGLGVSAIGAFSVLLAPAQIALVVNLPPALLRALGGLFLTGCVAFVVACLLRTTPISIGVLRLRLPAGGLALQQLVISVVDMAFSGAVLYALLPPGDIGFIAFMGLYTAAAIAGVASHVPGGVGVFEAVMLVALSPSVPAANLGAGLLGYRVIYYLLPFMLAASVLGIREATAGLGKIATTARGVIRVGGALAPLSTSLLSFLSGCVMLWSAATPALPRRLALLANVMPLAIIETSHLVAAAVGGGLIVIAHGLRHKFNGAWVLALVLALVGCVSAVFKGLDIEEAVLLGAFAVFLWLTRRRFYRQTALVNAPLSASGMCGILGALAGMYVLIAFSYKHVDYSHELWWQFEFGNEASRALRAAIGGAAAIFLWGIWRLLKPPPIVGILPTTAELDQVEIIARAQPYSDAWLALMGDKHLLFAEGTPGYVMYGVRGASWIAMSDPVGSDSTIEELAWRFRELADAHGGRVAFYKTRPANLPIYVDMGLTPYKLGDEAVVDLQAFSLDGGPRKTLRQTTARAERDGLTFEIVPRAAIAAHLDDLRIVSNEWLAAKQTREKRFSLGAFDPRYLARGEVAVVRQQSRLVAFASIMEVAPGGEASIDLMRHVAQVPNATMLYLFVQLLLHFKAQGYARFTLGMAPFSGLEQHPLAPWWHRFGHLIYAEGERFYNFQGLRQFKEKFDPIWEPRYLVSRPGFTPVRVMMDVAALISGGVSGIVIK